jgi:microcystin-dependent protein
MNPFIGEIRLMPYTYAPQDWLPCDGRQVPINQYQALAAILGTTYGGDARTYFNLPNMQGFAPVAPNTSDPTKPMVTQGKSTGAASVTLTEANYPSHNHGLNGISTGTPANRVNPPANNTQPGLVQLNGGTTSSTAVQVYTTATAPNTSFAPQAIGPSSTTAAVGHENRQPFLPLQFMIATNGVWPPRS